MRKFLSLFAVLVLASVLAFAQTKQVTGKVMDQTGQPVPFATIRIKDGKSGSRGVSADADGNYSIKVNQGATLLITGTGFATTEVSVGETPVLNVTVNRKENNLTEVVVTALGLSRSRNSLPYAAQQITGDQLTKGVTTNVVNGLSGKVAGLTITASNAMGGGSNVILRGNRSINQTNQALFVVDGVPYDNSNYTGLGSYDFGNATQDLNPDDIASMSVLKGAAASALYGSRGSNGVILITTKKGLNRKGLGVTASFGVSAGSPDKSTLPTLQTQYGEGYDGSMNNFAVESVPWAPSDITIAPTGADAGTGTAYDPSLMIYNWDAFSPTDPNFHKATPWKAASNHNPSDYFVTPFTTTENILVQSGGDNGSFKMGYTRDDETGYMPNSRIKKNLISLGATHNVTRGISLETGLNYVNEHAINRGIYAYTGGTSPMTDFRQWWPTNVDIKAQKRDYFNSHTNATWNWQDDGSYQDNALGSIGRPAYHDNLYWFSNQNPEVDSRNRITGYARVNADLTSYLKLLGSVSEDYYNQMIETRNDIGSQAPSFYSRQTNVFSETNFQLMLRFNKNIANNLNLAAMIGGNVLKNEVTGIFNTTNGGLILPGYWSISNSVNAPNPPTESDTRREIHSAFGQVTLSYKDMITLDGTIRRDQSSTLPAANNTYYYPSISGNFVFSKLMPEATWLSYGKLWGNFAQVGGDAPAYQVYPTYNINAVFAGQAVMSDQTTKSNQILVPEKNNTYEFGLEMNFLHSRVGFIADYYHSVQSNQILPVNVSTGTGYSKFNVNGGSVQNQGVEVTLNLTPVKLRDFSWEMNINWSKNMNKVLSLYGGQPSVTIQSYQNSLQEVAEVGKPYGELRGTDYKYINGQKVINAKGYYETAANPLTDIANFNPDWIGGINNHFTYKNLTLSFLIDVHQGGDVYSLDMDYGSFSGLYPRTAGVNDLGNPVRSPLASGGGLILKGVTEDGKVNTKRVGEDLGTGSWTFGSGANQENASQFVYKASYVKLRELSIAYALPNKFIEGIRPIRGINLALSGRNLWIIHKDLPYSDPEQGQAVGNGSQGYQNGAYPTMRTVSFNVKVNF